jgi:hypothetical protein
MLRSVDELEKLIPKQKKRRMDKKEIARDIRLSANELRGLTISISALTYDFEDGAYPPDRFLAELGKLDAAVEHLKKSASVLCSKDQPNL